ncbi:MAG TPA: GTP 3',8-cyclase MoaA [Sandaracinaceae bacterium LLY-WYZ-13_1]|nr:GTP 3',8-cyclase MoaA [Sandaracinaceae bacterium LLY-WYZ-13_1]
MDKRALPVVDSRVAQPQRLPPRPPGFAEAEPPPLTDREGRVYTYLRLSLTDRCNLACVYCMPPGGEHEHALRPDLLSFEEASRLVRVFGESGVRRVRFTGGEPLVRKDVVRLVEMVKNRTPVEELVMTTNAVRLPELARPLVEAGLSGVNVSIDSLDPDRFREVTRGGQLGPVLAGVHAALDAGLEVKLNIVALGGLTDHEAGDLVDWAWDLGLTPRFIELMPLGEAAALPAERFLSADQLVALLGDRVERDAARASDPGKGPARYLPAADGSGRRVGFITAISDEFCETCNRVRVTAKGDVRACLADRKAVSLRDLMRGGASDADLSWAIHWSLSTKDAGHHFNAADVDEHEHVGMSLIGG